MPELLEEYLSSEKSTQSVNSRERLRRRISASIEIFASMGITEPRAEDFDRLREIVAAKPGKSKGTLNSTYTVNDWVSATKSYYKWKAGRQQMTIAVEEISSTDSLVKQEEEPESVLTTPRRGRKPNPDKANRVQLSIYLDREVYENMQEIASFSNKNLSEIFSDLAVFFIQNNAEELDRVRQARREVKFKWN